MPPASRKTTAPFGLWPSSLDAADVARGARRFGMLQSDGASILWTESRPEEKGRQVLMRTGPGPRLEELIPAPFSARSRVHEYGGGEFLAAAGRLFFVNDADQDIYEIVPEESPRRLTAEPHYRFADMALDTRRNRVIAVAERQRKKGQYPDNLIVAISLDRSQRGKLTPIVTGHDFFAAPRLSPDCRKLAYLAWNLPNMPWDNAALHVTLLDAKGRPGRTRRIAGGEDSAAFQPEWHADGRLFYVSDETGWGNLYVWDGRKMRPAFPRGETDLMRPHWVFGMRSFALAADGSVAAIFLADGNPVVRFLSGQGSAPVDRSFDLPRLDDPVAAGDKFAGIGSSHTTAAGITVFGQAGTPVDVYRPAALTLSEAEVSVGIVRTFRRADGIAVHGVYYPPQNAKYRGPGDAAPPALILAHGGPTSMAGRGLSPRIQFYTNRGFAVLDVDYAGSTGYGRNYRERLDGRWGVADVADCAAAAEFLAESRLADRARIAIAGGSAGGYTVLMALATTDVFAAGSSHYGISDLSLLLAHTHKFEAGYLHRLMGTTPRSWKRKFSARSPIALIDGISSPVILFQGLDDKVVPPEQSRLIADELKKKGIRADLHEFEGEGHGFRGAETIVAVLEAELRFLRETMRIG